MCTLLFQSKIENTCNVIEYSLFVSPPPMNERTCQMELNLWINEVCERRKVSGR